MQDMLSTRVVYEVIFLFELTHELMDSEDLSNSRDLMSKDLSVLEHSARRALCHIPIGEIDVDEVAILKLQSEGKIVVSHST